MKTESGSFSAGMGGNGSKSYQCSACNSVVTYSDRLVVVSGSMRHGFANPIGVFCDFYTFSSCPGAVAFGTPTEEFSWFAGYFWNLALCKSCNSHLGWHYTADPQSEGLPEFWGILAHKILTRHS